MKLIIIIFLYIIVIIQQKDGKINLNIRLFNYKNPSDVRYDGQNCEKFYWLSDYCDPIFRICISAAEKCDILNKNTYVFNNMKEIFTVFTESIPVNVWQKKISVKVIVDDQDSYNNIDHIATFEEIFHLQTAGIFYQKSLMVNPRKLNIRLQASISTTCWPGYYGPLCDKDFNEYKCIKDCVNGKCLWNEKTKIYFCSCENSWTGLNCNELLTSTKLRVSTGPPTRIMLLNISKVKFPNFYKRIVKTTEPSIFKQSSKLLTAFKIIYKSTTPSKQIYNTTKIIEKTYTENLPNFSIDISSLKNISTLISINQKTGTQKLDSGTSKPATISTKHLKSEFTSATTYRFNYKLFKKLHGTTLDRNPIFRGKSLKRKIHSVPNLSSPNTLFSSKNSSTTVNPNLSSSSTHQNLKSTQLITTDFLISSTDNSLTKSSLNTTTFYKQQFAFNITYTEKMIVKNESTISKSTNSVTFNSFNNLTKFTKFIFNTSDQPILSSESSLKVSTKMFLPKNSKMSNNFKFVTTPSQPFDITKRSKSDKPLSEKKTTIQLISNKLNLFTMTSENINQNSITKINKIYLETSNKSVILTESNFNNGSFIYVRVSVLKLLNQTFNITYLLGICGAFWLCLIIMLIIIVIRKKQAVNKFDTNKFIYSHRKRPTANYLEDDLESEEVIICRKTNPSTPFKSKNITQKSVLEISNKNNDDNNEYETILRNLNNPNTESCVRLTYFSKTNEQSENNQNCRLKNNKNDISIC